MITQLDVRHFQCHAEESIPLGQVTVIVGPNDAGKSSLLRAIRWVCQNRPTGDAHVMDGAQDCLAVLHVDGRQVGRYRGPGRNTYFLGNAEYANIGTGVPDDIARVLQVDDINFAGQHDAAFWFTLSPGQVSKELNAIVNLDEIDTILAWLASARRKADTGVQVATQRVADAVGRRDGLAWVPDMQAAYTRLLTLADDAQRAAAAHDGLAVLMDTAKAATVRVRQAKVMAAAAGGLRALLDAYQRARGQHLALRNLVATARGISDELKAAREAKQAAETGLARYVVCPACKRPLLTPHNHASTPPVSVHQ